MKDREIYYQIEIDWNDNKHESFSIHGGNGFDMTHAIAYLMEIYGETYKNVIGIKIKRVR